MDLSLCIIEYNGGMDMKKFMSILFIVMVTLSTVTFSADYVHIAKGIDYDSNLNMDDLCQGLGDMYVFIMDEMGYGPKYEGSDELVWRVDGKTRNATIVKAENKRFVFTIPIYKDGDYYSTYMYLVSVYDKNEKYEWDDIDKMIDYMTTFGFRLKYIWKN